MKLISILLVLGTMNFAIAEDIVWGTHLKKPLSTTLTAKITAACKAIGKTCRVEEMPGKRLLHDSNAGLVDGDTSRVAHYKDIKKEKAANLVKINKAIIHVKTIVVTAPDFPKADVSWDGINKHKIGFIRGSAAIAKKIKKSQAKPVTNLEKAFKALKKGKIQGFVVFEAMAKKYMTDNSVSDFIIQEKALNEKDMFPYINKKHAALAPKFEAALK